MKLLPWGPGNLLQGTSLFSLLAVLPGVGVGGIHLQCLERITAGKHLLCQASDHLLSVQHSVKHLSYFIHLIPVGHLIPPLRNWWKAPLVFCLHRQLSGNMSMREASPGDLESGVCALGLGSCGGHFCRGANTTPEFWKVSRNFSEQE